MNNKLKIILTYVISTIVALLIALLALLIRDFFQVVDLKEKFRLLADAFFFPGSLFVLFGALIALTNQGSLDALSYGVRKLFARMIPSLDKERQNYTDYVLSKKRVRGYYFLFIVGGAFLLVSIIFVILFYKVM